ncbi:geranylgeranyl transferase type-2 subunit alpha [Tribolium madens]|uniref:geranylgeranyl transferase type-2 subunit alpha n=1 Tax=Tribolium madens TaxID=41895 RepID=UPI001CF71E23|nr:geranylgeranyl transferase type-2 subunit alpha [Tribolium madens]
MHGRIKVRTSEEQRLQKEKEQQKKLAAYRMGMKQILSTRNKENYDPASLHLSGQLLSVNPDIYTLWNYRKEVTLMELKENEAGAESEEKSIEFCENELRLTEQCLLSNPKSYGSWHHRYWILNHHPKPNWQREFDLCTKYLTMDDRNFHCWDFRRLLVNKIGITLTDEIAFSTERINVNFSNYSSWHYRSTLQFLTDSESVAKELTLVQNAVFTDPIDTSAWFYLRWVLSNPNLKKTQKDELLGALEQLQELEPDCKWIVMAKCWLSGNIAVLDKEHVENNVHYYKELIKLDPLRRGHYEDCLKSVEKLD